MQKRWAISHAPYFIDRHIMQDLKKTLQPHFNRTSKNRFREDYDTVFAFNNYHLLTGELSKHPFDLFFKELDTNGNSVLEAEEMSFFNFTVQQQESINSDCQIKNQNWIPKTEAESCGLLKKMVIEQFAPFSRHSWRYQSPGKSTDNRFMIVGTNADDTVSQLKNWKNHPTKFLCLNDGGSQSTVTDNRKTCEALGKFFSELFPKKSSFEK